MSIVFKSDAVKPLRELADAIKAGCLVQNATITDAEPLAVYSATLPEGWTQDGVNALAKHNNKYIAASRVAVAEMSAAIFEADQGVSEVNAQLGFLTKGDSLILKVEREHTFANPKASQKDAPADTPPTVTNQLVQSLTVKHRGRTGKSLRDAMSEEFGEMFKR